MSLTNYIVAGYPGRHSHHKYFQYQYGDCIINHLIELSNFKHNIDTITVVINNWEAENLSELNKLNSFLNVYCKINKNVEIKYNENNFISYGGFLKAFETRNKDYDNYILMEFDYSFCLDNFDEKLLQLKHDNNLNAMFAAWQDLPPHPEHGLVSLAIIDHKCFYDTFNLFKDKMKYGQLPFTRAFLNAGFKCGDWRNKYKTEFYRSTYNEIIDLSLDKNAERIVMPYQKILLT